MRLVDNVMRGDFLQDGLGNIGFVYKIDETIHIQMLEGSNKGNSYSDDKQIYPISITENFLKRNDFKVIKKYDGYEYHYYDSDSDYAHIAVTFYNDKSIFVRSSTTIICANEINKSICFVHELQHIFKELNIQKSWTI